jgi:hypothetical protein
LEDIVVISVLLGLLGIALQFAFLYWAIRLALQHDRAFQARQSAEVRTVRHTEVMPEPQDIEQIRRETRASLERAEARRIAMKSKG